MSLSCFVCRLVSCGCTQCSTWLCDEQGATASDRVRVQAEEQLWGEQVWEGIFSHRRLQTARSGRGKPDKGMYRRSNTWSSLNTNTCHHTRRLFFPASNRHPVHGAKGKSSKCSSGGHQLLSTGCFTPKPCLGQGSTGWCRAPGMGQSPTAQGAAGAKATPSAPCQAVPWSGVASTTGGNWCPAHKLLQVPVSSAGA